MSFRFKIATVNVVTACALVATGCSSDTDYAATSRNLPDPKQAIVAPEQVDVSAQSAASGEFFKKGQSLDLYVVMDKSYSLWESPEPFGGEGSDPSCLRLNALLDLIDGLREELFQKEEVRLNVITFGTFASSLGTISDILSVSRAELDQRLREPVCNKPNRANGNTFYSNALNLISEELKIQRGLKKLDIETAIFFSDGAARDRDEAELKSAIEKFNESFPKRAYGVLLGKTLDKCNIKNDAGDRLSTFDCVAEVVGSDSSRVVQSENAAKLSETMIQLLKK